MRTILRMCMFVLLLPRKLNGETTHSTSVFSQNIGTSKSHGSATRGAGTSIFSEIHNHQHITRLITEDGQPHSTISQDQHTTDHEVHKTTEVPNSTGLSLEENKTTVVQNARGKNESPSYMSSLATSKGQKEKSTVSTSQHEETSEEHWHSTTGVGYNTSSISNHDVKTTKLRPKDGTFFSKLQEQTTQEQHISRESQTERKTSERQITIVKRESPSLLSSLTTLRRQTKRSSDYSQTNTTTNSTAVQPDITTEQKLTSPNLTPTNNTVTDHHEQTSRSSGKIFSSQSNSTSPSQNTQAVTTNELGKVSEDSQTSMQTTEGSTQTQGNQSPNASTTDSSILQTSNSNTPSVTVGKDQGNTAPAFSNSAADSFMTSTESSTGHISTAVTKTVRMDISTTIMKTSEKTTKRKTSTTIHTSVLTTSGGKAMTKKDKNRNAGPTVAALITSVLGLMLIAIVVILVRKRRMQKKKEENPDWAGPSPFLECDAQFNQASHGEDGPLHRRDTKRISLLSFLPQRASQRLSLLVEEEVQMNPVVFSSTFGRNEQPQNGKPEVEKNKIQTETINDDPAPVVSSDSPVPDMVTDTASTGNDVNNQSPKPDETITSPSSETNTALPPPQSSEDVKVNPPESSTVHIPPAPPLP